MSPMTLPPAPKGAPRAAPAAAERTLRGVGRVAEIVRALRAFAHPDGDLCAPADVNSAIRDAAIVATGEYKQVASLKLDLNELPPVECNLGELNQVFLNLIVNAAHAIADRHSEGSGLIQITSRVEPGGVCVRVSDNGAGVPEAVRSRIFEPFFTTKPLGKGTGQGLALAHTMVEVRHGGQLTFETELGVGTTFIVRLPMKRVQKVSRAA
jgi:signal transduction histidine kinase